MHKGQIWLPRSLGLIEPLLHEFHSTPTGGHMGITKTLAHLSDNFTWTGMKDDVRKFVLACKDCQQTKSDHRKSPGLLWPLPVPVRPWEDLSLDFIGGLPIFKGHTVVLVFVDRFSKGIHLGSLPSHHTAFNVAHLFMEIVGKLHGMPHSLVSDCDPLFLSRFWQELFRLSGTKLRMSSAYHPQSDGQTEVMNMVVEQYLRAFVHSRPATWGRYLMWAEWSYNTSIHSGTQMTPYEVTFGKPPPSIPQYITGSSTVDAVDDFLSNREKLFEKLRKKLLKAQGNMKHFADRNRRDVKFEVDDWVFVKLRPRRQVSLTGNSHPKLTKRFFGPFQITQKVGPVAYQLRLPSYLRIHPIFHCSLLKPCHDPPDTSDTVELPPSSIGNDPLVSPLVILNTKWDTERGTPNLKVLVQWAGLHPDDATWESWEELKAEYHLEDKVLFEAQGNVTNEAPQSPLTEPQAEQPLTERNQRQRTKPRYLKDFIV